MQPTADMQSLPATIDPQLLIRRQREDVDGQAAARHTRGRVSQHHPAHHVRESDAVYPPVGECAAAFSDDAEIPPPWDLGFLQALMPMSAHVHVSPEATAPPFAALSCPPLIWDARSTDSPQQFHQAHALDHLANGAQDGSAVPEHLPTGGGLTYHSHDDGDQIFTHEWKSCLPFTSSLNFDDDLNSSLPHQHANGSDVSHNNNASNELCFPQIRLGPSEWDASTALGSTQAAGITATVPDYDFPETLPAAALPMYSDSQHHDVTCIHPEVFGRRCSAPVVPTLGHLRRSASSDNKSTPGAAIETNSRAQQISYRVRRHSDKHPTRPTAVNTLQIIRETGDGRQLRPNQRSTKGIRSGPLIASSKENAKRCRQQKTICIRCKLNRKPCIITASGACSECIHRGLTAKWRQPCTKASFLGIVESGTCIYISQRAVNHLTLDGQHRVRIELPATLDLDNLLEQVALSEHSFDVRVRQASGSLYVLNLSQCYKYLNTLRHKQPDSQRDLRGFIDHEILSASDWQDCVDECSPFEGLMTCLSTWGNMPSRASYSYIPRDQRGGMGDTTENVMDVEDAADRKAIIMAAQLSRIVCRKLEVEAYSYLQRALNEWSSFSSTEMLRFARELGHVLLTLRWRVSWWELLGNGGAVPDPKGREAFAYRVNELCRVLYFYYRMICAKLLGSSAGKELYGVWSTYPDTSLPVFESFPSEDSIEGFARWMLEGQQLIVNAGVEGKLAGIGLRHQRLAENRTSGS